jgi:hypothetical protein
MEDTFDVGEIETKLASPGTSEGSSAHDYQLFRLMDPNQKHPRSEASDIGLKP